MVHSKFSNESTTMHKNFLGEYGVSAIFNVSNPSIFYVGDDSRSNPFKKRGNDENQQASQKDLLEVLIGLITRRWLVWLYNNKNNFQFDWWIGLKFH